VFEDRKDKYVMGSQAWNMIGNEGERAKTILNTGTGINVDGPAGTGKTYLIKQLVAELEERGKQYAVLAPTNKAALLIGGTTIHKCFKMAPGEYKIPQARMQYLFGLDYVIIDEISMVDADIYNMLLQLKKITSIRYILSGDFRQLPPVEDVEIAYKESMPLKELCDFNRMELTENMRSDAVMWDILSDVNLVNPTEYPHEITNINMSFTNRKRKEVNEMCSKRATETCKSLHLPMCAEDDYTQEIDVVKGTPIISRKNNKMIDVFNNETFVVKSFDVRKQNITISNDSKTLQLDTRYFQKDFAVAYCTTVHKMQGATINEPFTIHEWDRFDKRLKYTAMSRTTNKNLINIITAMKKTSTFKQNILAKLTAHRDEDISKKRGFNLTVKDVKTMIKEQDGKCTKCKIDLLLENYSAKASAQFSVDRLDNKRGHVKGNVVVNCHGCNQLNNNQERRKKITEF
jgi:molybdopterin-guanine dinucleotide biosynthesis protein